MKKILWVAFFTLGGAVALGAAEGTYEDAQDVLYLGEGRPAVLRLHLSYQGTGIVSRWDAWMTKLYRFLDRNASGGLDRVEAGKAPSIQQMQQFLQGDLTILPGRAAQPAVPFDQLDADRDGKVVYEEFCAYYRANGGGPVQVSGNATGTGQDTLTDRVFGLLDANKDGKLSKAELAAAETVLGRFDTNDDELVSPAELGGAATTAGVRFLQAAAVVQAMQPQPPAPPALLLVPRDDGNRRAGITSLAREVVNRLDKDKSGKLDVAESRLPKEQFGTLDRNKDGKLDVIELSRWIGGKPDGEFTLRLGSRNAMAPPRPAARPRPNDDTSLRLENVRLTVLTNDVAVPPLANLSRALQQQYRLVDREKKGFVVKKQLDATMHFYLVSLFDIADRNTDGRLTEEEIKEFVELYKGAFGNQLSLSLASTGSGMFQTLDMNRDGRLGVRELRHAWKSLKDFDADGDGEVGRSEFPRQFNLTVSPTVNYAAVPQFFEQYDPTAGYGTRPQGRGPVWFQKMDRNGDGDVSRLEWLGSREEFDRVDADRDGLIGLAEAEAADARWRKKD